MFSRLIRFTVNALHFVAGAINSIAKIPKLVSDPKAWGAELKDQLSEFESSVTDLKKYSSETSQQVLYTSVGRALTDWARMEETIVALVALLLRRPVEIAGLVMFSILNFHVWLSLIHDLFEQDEILKVHQTRWNKISERIRAIKDKRDQIAHHPAELPETSLIASTAQLQASRFDVRRKSRTQKPLDTSEILKLAETIALISQDIVVLFKDVHATLETSLKTSALPASDHSTRSGSQ